MQHATRHFFGILKSRRKILPPTIFSWGQKYFHSTNDIIRFQTRNWSNFMFEICFMLLNFLCLKFQTQKESESKSWNFLNLWLWEFRNIRRNYNWGIYILIYFIYIEFSSPNWNLITFWSKKFQSNSRFSNQNFPHFLDGKEKRRK